MIMRLPPSIIRPAMALAMALLTNSPARADDDRVPPVSDPVVRKECGACHMAFQPAFLPARSWNLLMDDLAHHFGDDASLPAGTAGTIRAYLTANAGDVATKGRARKAMRGIAPAGTPLTITGNPDFQRKHGFADTVWRNPKVVTRSNCLACHPDADRGLYDDD